MRPCERPPHLLLLDEPLTDHLIYGRLDEARGNQLPVQRVDEVARLGPL
jgi:hypothetical protein